MADENQTSDAAFAPSDKITVKLSKPVQAHGEEIKELTFREPTGKDVLFAGDPLTVVGKPNGDFVFEVDEKKMIDMMATLAAVPPSTIWQLTSREWKKCSMALYGFFTPDPGTA